MVSSGLVDRVDVSHYRLAVHLMIAFIILSLILWNYFDLKNLIFLKKILILIYLYFYYLLYTHKFQLVHLYLVWMLVTIYNTWPMMGS